MVRRYIRERERERESLQAYLGRDDYRYHPQSLSSALFLSPHQAGITITILDILVTIKPEMFIKGFEVVVARRER